MLHARAKAACFLKQVKEAVYTYVDFISFGPYLSLRQFSWVQSTITVPEAQDSTCMRNDERSVKS